MAMTGCVYRMTRARPSRPATLANSRLALKGSASSTIDVSLLNRFSSRPA